MSLAGVGALWWRGQGSGFATALSFALWLNVTLAAWWAVPHLAPFWLRAVNAALLGLAWLYSIRRTAARLSQIYGGDGHYNDELFCRAQEEYVKGRWFEAESLLLRLLADDPADVEGRLLLATLYRHTRRGELASAARPNAALPPRRTVGLGSAWRTHVLETRRRHGRYGRRQRRRADAKPCGIAPRSRS